MSRSIVVREMTADDDSHHVAFLDRLTAPRSPALAYHYPFYRDVLQRHGMGEPLYLGAWLKAELVGILPGFIRRSPVGTVYCSLPFFGPNAGVICAEDDKSASVHEALLGAAVARMRSCGDALSATFYTPFLCENFEVYDAVLEDSLSVQRLTNFVELPGFKLTKSIEWDVRKAARSHVTIKDEITPGNIDAFYNIYRQNCLDLGIPLKGKGIVESLLQPRHKERVRASFAFRDGSMIAGLIYFCSRVTASYWMPASRGSERTYQAGTALLSRALEEARARGLRYWNWEASPSRDSGVYRFKKKWGGADSVYRIYVLPFRDKKCFSQIGQAEMTRHFPYFFVYPFDLL